LGNAKTREPKQQRAIEKKERIVQAAFKIICEKGYYKTNITSIAKEAGVAPGTLYSYFEDKKDIYLDMYAMYFNEIAAPMFKILGELKPPVSIKGIVDSAMDTIAQCHSTSKRLHDEITTMIYIDKDVGALHKKVNMDAVSALSELMSACGVNTPNLREKIYIALELVESYAHKVVYNELEELDFSNVRNTIVNVILSMLTE
jgi:AcrR family transcriptional regulator